MRTGELDCIHGVGHSAGIHGCDGCCIPLVQQARAEAWEEGAVWQRANAVPDDRRMKVRFVSELQAVNPYRQGEN